PGEPDSLGGSQIILSSSINGGQSWEPQLSNRTDTNTMETVLGAPSGHDTGLYPNVPGSGYVNWSHLAIGPAGDVYVSMFEYNYFEIFHITFDNAGSVTSVVGPDTLTGQGLPFGYVPVGGV